MLCDKNFPSKSIENSVLKSKKSMCDTSECHVLFEWPLRTEFEKLQESENKYNQSLSRLKPKLLF